VLEEDAVCEPVAVSELDGVPVLLGVDVCGRWGITQTRQQRKVRVDPSVRNRDANTLITQPITKADRQQCKGCSTVRSGSRPRPLAQNPPAPSKEARRIRHATYLAGAGGA